MSASEAHITAQRLLFLLTAALRFIIPTVFQNNFQLSTFTFCFCSARCALFRAQAFRSHRSRCTTSLLSQPVPAFPSQSPCRLCLRLPDRDQSHSLTDR